MTIPLKVLLISDPGTHRRIDEVARQAGIDCRILLEKDFYSFLRSDDLIPDVAVIGPGKATELKSLLLDLVAMAPRIPTVVILDHDDFVPQILAEMSRSGACGVVEDENLNSLAQFLASGNCRENDNNQPLQDDFIEGLLEFIMDRDESMVSVIDEYFRYRAVNSAFSKRLNVSKNELKGKSPEELWGKEVFESKIRKNLEKSMGGEVIRYKAYFDVSGISGKCFEVVYRPFRHGRGAEKYTVVETRDITETENQLAEAEKIRQKNHYFEKFLPFGVFECSSDGTVMNANEAFCNILEIDDPAGINLSSHFSTDRRFMDYLKTVKQGESSTFSQLKMATSTGSEIYARISSHVRNDSEGGLILNATLEDNTREVLLERKLIATHRMETLGNLAGGIAHDFNTILATIAGYTEMTLQEVESGSGVFEYMTRINSAIEKAESVINQMLTFSRQVAHEKVFIRLPEVFEEAVQFIKAVLPDNIMIEKDIDESEGYVFADPTQLFRVFINIFTNALQAMESGGGVLGLRLLNRFEKEGNDSVEIRVSDSGCGIDRSVIDRIYEPFFTTKEVGKGTGMGLAVSHGIITELGGDINAESTPGKGTTITITLPMYRDKKEPDGITGARTILYADDNLHFSRTMSIALESLGYRVLLASSDDDLIEILKDPRPAIDLFFIRCHPDNYDRREELLPLLSGLKNKRIILITSQGGSNITDFARRNRHFVSVLQEPVSLKDMLSSIHAYCS